jgi:hypothetical protein
VLNTRDFLAVVAQEPLTMYAITLMPAKSLADFLGYSLIPKSEDRFPACAKPCQLLVLSFGASADEGRSERIMLEQQAKANVDST